MPPGLEVFEGRNQLGSQPSSSVFLSDEITSGVIDIALKKTSAPLAASSVSCASTDVSVASYVSSSTTSMLSAPSMASLKPST